MNDALHMTADEWHEWRRQGVGGSDIAALVGLSQWASPTSLYYEKTGQLNDVRPDTERQRIGRRMESVLADEFADKTGLHCVGAQTLWAHPRHPFARCTLDGLAVESDRDDDDPNVGEFLGPVEFKTDGRFGWPDGVPPNIRAQCVWAMGVTGRPMSWLVVMFASFRVEVYELPFDDVAQSDWEFMLSTADRFWNRHVLAGEPPPADDHPATTDALSEVFTPDPASFLVANDEYRQLVDAVRDAQAATKAAKAQEDTLRNQLREVLADSVDLVDGYDAKDRPIVIASWRPQTAHRFDTTSFRQDFPDLADAYTVEADSRVLRIHKPKGAT